MKISKQILPASSSHKAEGTQSSVSWPQSSLPPTRKETDEVFQWNRTGSWLNKKKGLTVQIFWSIPSTASSLTKGGDREMVIKPINEKAMKFTCRWLAVKSFWLSFWLSFWQLLLPTATENKVISAQHGGNLQDNQTWCHYPKAAPIPPRSKHCFPLLSEWTPSPEQSWYSTTVRPHICEHTLKCRFDLPEVL